MSQRNWKTSSSRRRGRGATGAGAGTGTSAYARTNSGNAGGLGRLDESAPAVGGGAEGGSGASVGLDTLMEDLSLMDSVSGRAKNKASSPQPSAAKNNDGPPQVGASQPSSRPPTFSSTSTPFGSGAGAAGRTATYSGRVYSTASDDVPDEEEDQSVVTRSTAITGVTAYREAEGPTIYARDRDDDMSQITSSLAGNTVGSTAYYFGSTATGGGGGGNKMGARFGRRDSGGDDSGPGPNLNHHQDKSDRMTDDDYERSAELAQLENGIQQAGGGAKAGDNGPRGSASVAQSVGGLEYILSNSRGAGAAANGNKESKVTAGNMRGSRSVSDTLEQIDVTAYVGNKSSGSVYSRRGGNAAGAVAGGVSGGLGSGSGHNDDGNRSVVSNRSFGSRASSGGSQSRYVPSVAYQTHGTSLCANIQAILPGPIAALFVYIVRATEPCWINARRLCCTLRNTVLPGSPRHTNKKFDSQSKGGSTVSSLESDDYFSKLMGGAGNQHSSSASVVSQTPQQQRLNQVLYILRMLVAGALCGVIFLGLERVVLGDRRMPQGPGDMDVDEYGRAMNNFRQRRGVDAANHIRAGMAHHKGNPDAGGGGPGAGVEIPGLEPNIDITGDAEQENMNDFADEGEGQEIIDGKMNPDDAQVVSITADGQNDGMEYADGMGGKHAWVEIPPQLDNLADVDDVPVHKDDLAYYWHIPRSAGASMNDILGGCLKLTIASDAGGRQGHDKDEMLKEVEFPSKIKYVNVDTSNGPGIQRAKSLGLAESGMADVFMTSLLYDGASVFDENHRARLFTMFRHPVHRAVSLFHFIQDTVWRRQETFDKVLSKITLDEYYKGGMGESNWMTRFLSNEHTSEIDEGHLEVAKAIIRRKCLVGLMDEKSDSLARFEAYFGWKLRSEAERECHDKKLNWAWPLKHRHDDVEEGSDLWNLIAEHNKYDVLLYEFAEQLYREQGKMFTA